MSKYIEKLRQESWGYHNNEYKRYPFWREAILEAIFRPKMKDPPGKSPMSHLHPDLHKLHMPANIYIADWRKYRVEDHVALMRFQKRCHQLGLHDPWLKNYCWMFYSNQRKHRSRFATITLGFTWGVAFGTILAGMKWTYLYFYPMEYQHSPEYIAKYGNQEVYH